MVAIQKEVKQTAQQPEQNVQGRRITKERKVVIDPRSGQAYYADTLKPVLTSADSRWSGH